MASLITHNMHNVLSVYPGMVRSSLEDRVMRWPAARSVTLRVLFYSDKCLSKKNSITAFCVYGLLMFWYQTCSAYKWKQYWDRGLGSAVASPALTVDAAMEASHKAHSLGKGFCRPDHILMLGPCSP